MSGIEIENQEFQTEEILVLQSIYPTEFSILSENKLRIHVSPCEIECEAHGINEIPYLNSFTCNYIIYFRTIVKVNMVFELHSDYPISSVPSISLEIVKGLSPCALDELYEVAMNTATNNIGNSSIHSIVESAKDWLRDNNFAGNNLIHSIRFNLSSLVF